VLEENRQWKSQQIQLAGKTHFSVTRRRGGDTRVGLPAQMRAWWRTPLAYATGPQNDTPRTPASDFGVTK